MFQKITFFIVSMLICGIAFSQSAFVQVVHNSPILGSNAGPVVDIYVNGTLQEELTGVEFRSATGFLELPSDTEILVEIKNSPSEEDDEALEEFNLGALSEGVYYSVVACGVMGGFPGIPDFDLFVHAQTKITSDDEDKVAVNAFHGGILVPPVDVSERMAGFLFEVDYGTFTEYVELDEGVYYLDVEVQGIDDLVYTFRADLNGLAGSAAMIFASGAAVGFPELGLFAALPDGTVVELPFSPVARAQIVHNSPTGTVDIYINGELALDNFEFKTATGYMYLPAEVNLEVAIALPDSESIDDAIATFQVFLENRETYTIVANGIFDDPDYPLTVNAYGGGSEIGQTENEVDLRVIHGSPGAPGVDILIKDVGVIFEGLGYLESSTFASLDEGVYYVDIVVEGTSDLVASFIVPVAVDLIDQSINLIASGIVGGDPAFGLFAVLADGTVIEFDQLFYTRVQLIHNSPEVLVDVYLNATKIFENFEYRSATSYIDFPAGEEFVVSLAPGGSSGVEEAIEAFTVNLDPDKTYVIVANGIYDSQTVPLKLTAFDQAREVAENPENIDLLAFHGSQGAPDVDIAARGISNLFEGLTYDAFDGYIEVEEGVYQLDILPTGENQPFITYEADLSGLAGQSVTILASGVFGGEPGFALFAVLSDGSFIELPQRSFSRVQIIHNSPDPVVDVYVNGNLVLDDFAFRTATPYLDLNSDFIYDIAIAPGDSESADDAITTYEFDPEGGVDYVIVANGILDDADFPFTLQVFAGARSQANNETLTDVLIHHGAPGAPAVDISLSGGPALLENLSYGDFEGYTTIFPSYYLLDLKASGSPDILATYEADLRGLEGRSAVVFASGLLVGEPEFGLFAALDDGTIVELPVRSFARLQVVHNVPDVAVDVYINGNISLENFEFRSATPYIDMVAGIPVTVSLAPAGSQSAAEAVVEFDINLAVGSTSIAVVNGIVGDPDFQLTLNLFEGAREFAIGGQTSVDVTVHHGSPGAPAVDIDILDVFPLVQGLSYGDFTAYVPAPPAFFYLAIRPSGSPDPVGVFYADLRSLAGQSAIVFASGLIGSEPGFGLFAALADGTVIEFPSIGFTGVQLLHNSPRVGAVDIYVNDLIALSNFEFRSATNFIELPTRVAVDIAIAPAGSSSSAEAVATFQLELEDDQNYIVVANGIVGDPDYPFELLVIGNARTASEDEFFVEISVLHGSPFTGSVDVDSRYDGNIVSEFAFGQSTPYLELDPKRYLLDLRLNPSDDIAATYIADVSSLAGNAGLVFASGILGETGEDAFGLYLLLTDGSVIQLPSGSFGRVQIIHNSPQPTVDIYVNDDLAVSDLTFRRATPFVELPAGTELIIGVAPAGSTSVNDVIASFPLTLENAEDYIAIAYGIVGNGARPFDLEVISGARLIANNSNETDLLLFHGSPDAPTVDVVVRGAGSIVDGLSYGDLEGYISVEPADYIVDIIPSGTSDPYKSYNAPLSLLQGQAITVFASGFVNEVPGFELWVALANGVTLPLEELVNVRDLSAGFESLKVYPNPVTNTAFVEMEVTESLENVMYKLIDISGRIVQSTNLDRIPAGKFNLELNVHSLTSGVYQVMIISEKGAVTMPLVVGSN